MQIGLLCQLWCCAESEQQPRDGKALQSLERGACPASWPAASSSRQRVTNGADMAPCSSPKPHRPSRSASSSPQHAQHQAASIWWSRPPSTSPCCTAGTWRVCGLDVSGGGAMMNGKSLPMKGMSTATISAPMTVPGMAARKLPDARVELPPPLDRLCRAGGGCRRG